MMRIGIVGTGGMGAVHYYNYAHITGCKVVALVGINEQSRQRAAEWGLPLYPDITGMAHAEQIDILDVCSPTFLHKQHVLEGLSCGLHVITEKPAALHAQDVHEMFTMADWHNRQLYVAQVLQFSKETAVLRQLVQSGEYGAVLDASFERLSARPEWVQNDWLFEKDKSGLLPFDLHIHDLDLIVSLFGKPASMTFTSSGRANLPYKEHYRFLYQYPHLHVAAEAAWYHASFPFTARWRVYFENAVVVNDGDRVVAYPYNAEPRVFDTQDELQIPTGINIPVTGMFHRELLHFVHCAERNIPSNCVPREQVLAVIELLEEICRDEHN